MKKLFLSVVAAVLATVGFAQNNLVATLVHNDTISTYYGTSALSQAHEAAVNGDVITLSSGSFSACDITKAITLRGAGMELDTVNHIAPTVINGDFKLNAFNDSCFVTLEGLSHTGIIYTTGNNKLISPTFIKCRLGAVECRYQTGYYVSDYWYSSMENAKFVNCKVTRALAFSGTASFLNCIIMDLYHHHSSIALSINNSILIYNGHNPSQINNSVLNNNYVYLSESANRSAFPEQTLLYNNVVNVDSICINSPNNTNKVAAASDFFKTFNGTYSDSEIFELTSEAASTYLGDDGTQVGIYGGTLPFDPKPTYPRLVKCNVAGKSAQDGTLSVELKIE